MAVRSIRPEPRSERGSPPPAIPPNELHDRACDLLDAAQRLRRAAATPGSWPAITATLGCVKAALDELSGAVADMGPHSSTHTGGRAATATRDLFERLRLQLTLAQSTCGAARESVGPLLARGPGQAA